VFWEESGKICKLKKKHMSIASVWEIIPKLYCIIHVLGFTVISYLIAIVIILQTEFLRVHHVLSVTSFSFERL